MDTQLARKTKPLHQPYSKSQHDYIIDAVLDEYDNIITLEQQNTIYPEYIDSFNLRLTTSKGTQTVTLSGSTTTSYTPFLTPLPREFPSSYYRKTHPTSKYWSEAGISWSPEVTYWNTGTKKWAVIYKSIIHAHKEIPWIEAVEIVNDSGTGDATFGAGRLDITTALNDTIQEYFTPQNYDIPIEYVRREVKIAASFNDSLIVMVEWAPGGNDAYTGSVAPSKLSPAELKYGIIQRFFRINYAPGSVGDVVINPLNITLPPQEREKPYHKRVNTAWVFDSHNQADVNKHGIILSYTEKRNQYKSRSYKRHRLDFHEYISINSDETYFLNFNGVHVINCIVNTNSTLISNSKTVNSFGGYIVGTASGSQNGLLVSLGTAIYHVPVEVIGDECILNFQDSSWLGGKQNIPTGPTKQVSGMEWVWYLFLADLTTPLLDVFPSTHRILLSKQNNRCYIIDCEYGDGKGDVIRTWDTVPGQSQYTLRPSNVEDVSTTFNDTYYTLYNSNTLTQQTFQQPTMPISGEDTIVKGTFEYLGDTDVYNIYSVANGEYFIRFIVQFDPDLFQELEALANSGVSFTPVLKLWSNDVCVNTIDLLSNSAVYTLRYSNSVPLGVEGYGIIWKESYHFFNQSRGPYAISVDLDIDQTKLLKPYSSYNKTQYSIHIKQRVSLSTTPTPTPTLTPQPTKQVTPVFENRCPVKAPVNMQDNWKYFSQSTPSRTTGPNLYPMSEKDLVLLTDCFEKYGLPFDIGEKAKGYYPYERVIKASLTDGFAVDSFNFKTLPLTPLSKETSRVDAQQGTCLLKFTLSYYNNAGIEHSVWLYGFFDLWARAFQNGNEIAGINGRFYVQSAQRNFYPGIITCPFQLNFESLATDRMNILQVPGGGYTYTRRQDDFLLHNYGIKVNHVFHPFRQTLPTAFEDSKQEHTIALIAYGNNQTGPTPTPTRLGRTSWNNCDTEKLCVTYSIKQTNKPNITFNRTYIKSTITDWRIKKPQLKSKDTLISVYFSETSYSEYPLFQYRTTSLGGGYYWLLGYGNGIAQSITVKDPSLCPFTDSPLPANIIKFKSLNSSFTDPIIMPGACGVPVPTPTRTPAVTPSRTRPAQLLPTPTPTLSRTPRQKSVACFEPHASTGELVGRITLPLEYPLLSISGTKQFQVINQPNNFTFPPGTYHIAYDGGAFAVQIPGVYNRREWYGLPASISVHQNIAFSTAYENIRTAENGKYFKVNYDQYAAEKQACGWKSKSFNVANDGPIHINWSNYEEGTSVFKGDVLGRYATDSSFANGSRQNPTFLLYRSALAPKATPTPTPTRATVYSPLAYSTNTNVNVAMHNRTVVLQTNASTRTNIILTDEVPPGTELRILRYGSFGAGVTKASSSITITPIGVTPSPTNEYVTNSFMWAVYYGGGEWLIYGDVQPL